MQHTYVAVLMANVLKINVFFQHVRCRKSMEMKKNEPDPHTDLLSTLWSVYFLHNLFECLLHMYMSAVFLTSYHLKKLFKSTQWERFNLGIQSLNMKMVWNISSALGVRVRK